MKLFSGEFETGEDGDGYFAISITQESDCSSDGGYTFEEVTNTFYIDNETAQHLVEELQHFIKPKF